MEVIEIGDVADSAEGFCDDVAIWKLSSAAAVVMDNVVVVLIVVFKYRRGEVLKGRLFQLLVLRLIGGTEAEFVAATDEIAVVLSISVIILDDWCVASVCVDDISPRLLSTVPTDCVPELPGDDADKVTPEAPLPENMPDFNAEVLSTADVTKYVCVSIVVTVKVSENGPEGEGGRV